MGAARYESHSSSTRLVIHHTQDYVQSIPGKMNLAKRVLTPQKPCRKFNDHSDAWSFITDLHRLNVAIEETSSSLDNGFGDFTFYFHDGNREYHPERPKWSGSRKTLLPPGLEEPIP